MLQLTTIVFLIALSLLAGVHIIAIELFLYWNIWWLDIPMHAYGGMIVALGFFALRDLRLFPNTLLKFFPVLFLVLLVALAWEAYEFLIDMPEIGNYYVDTGIDLCMGLLGGAIGFVVGNNLRNLR